MTEGALDLLRHHAEDLGPDKVRSLLRKAIKRGSAAARQAAYRVGAERSGLAFARPARRDKARMVRDRADKLLARDTSKAGRKANPRRRSSPSQDT
jgi:hypothetical protein